MVSLTWFDVTRHHLLTSMGEGQGAEESRCSGLRESASSTTIKEPSQFDFPRFLFLSSSILVVYKLGSQCSLQTIPHGHSHSVFNSVVFWISSLSIWCVFFFNTLGVLDFQNNCEQYFCILHNQFPLLPLYISIEHLFNLMNPH